MATLEQYDFRQQRRQAPDSKKLKEENLRTDTSASTQLGYSSLEDDIRQLKIFDLDYTYGPTIAYPVPCILLAMFPILTPHTTWNEDWERGYRVTRLQRWERAKTFGLNPPARVKELVEKHKDDSRYTECLWNDTILGERSATAD